MYRGNAIVDPFFRCKIFQFLSSNPGSPSESNPVWATITDFNKMFSSKMSILYTGRNSYTYSYRNGLNYKFSITLLLLAYNLNIFMCPGNTSGPPIPISILRSPSLLRSAPQPQRPLADSKKGAAAALIPTPQPRERGPRRRPHASARFICIPTTCTCSRGRTLTCRPMDRRPG